MWSSLFVSKKISYNKLVRKSLSAFCSSASKNLASVSVGHSLSEAVLLLSVELLGLICSEHINPPFGYITLQFSIILEIFNIVNINF